MAASSKKLLIFFIVAPLYCQTFSQSQSASSLYISGEALLDKNLKEAFRLLENAMNLSREKGEMETYLKSVNKLAFISDKSNEGNQEQIFEWLKEAIEFSKGYDWTNDLAQLH